MICRLHCFLGFAAAISLSGPATAADAYVSILNAARAPESLSVAICTGDGAGCEDIRLKRDEVVEAITLAPGRHRIEASADGTAIETFRFGAAENDHLALLLFGYGEKPVVKGWWSLAKSALGGVEERVVNRYQLESLILPLELGKPGDRPMLRLVNLAPGLGPVSAQIHEDTKVVTLAATKYASASPKKDAGPGEVRVVVAVDGARTPAAESKLTLAPGSNHILAVTGMEANGEVQIVELVANPADASR